MPFEYQFETNEYRIKCIRFGEKSCTISLCFVIYMLHWLQLWCGKADMASDDTFTAGVPKEIFEDPAFTEWEDDADGNLLQRVEAAKTKITSEGVITSAKDLKDGLYEKKWTSGLRLYFAVVEKDGKKTLLLLGSGKGDQQKAIDRSREILQKYKVIKENIKKN